MPVRKKLDTPFFDINRDCRKIRWNRVLTPTMSHSRACFDGFLKKNDRFWKGKEDFFLEAKLQRLAHEFQLKNAQKLKNEFWSMTRQGYKNNLSWISGWLRPILNKGKVYLSLLLTTMIFAKFQLPLRKTQQKQVKNAPPSCYMAYL